MMSHEVTRPTSGRLWSILPDGRFRLRVLISLVRDHWFVRLRWVFVAMATLLLVAERYSGTASQRPRLLWLTVLLLACVNIAWLVLGRRLCRSLSEVPNGSPELIRRIVLFVNAQMTVDIFLLTVMLRCSGGIENPMAIFYLFHMLIAALLLKPGNALLQGAWALVLAGALGIGECVGLIEPHYPFVDPGGGGPRYESWSFVITGIGVLAAGIGGTLYFTLQISSQLDAQEDELYRANAALRESQAAVERLQAKRSQFMRTASHQLKGPLTGIQTLAGLIRDGVVAPGNSGDLIERIINRCRDAIAQVNELLTLEHIEHAPPDRHWQAPTAVGPALERLVQRATELACSRDITLHADLDACAETTVAVNERDFDDCVWNLLDNAVKYTPEGGAVTLTCRPDGDAVQLTVRDTGMGIAEESIDDIFEPFQRGNEALASNIGGSGLGLTIVREVVEQARGSITVNSTVGAGSEFCIRLPSTAKSGSSSNPS